VWNDQKGFTLVEVLVSIFILSLIAVPLITMLTFGLHEFQGARERTKKVYAVQGLLEPVLDPAEGVPVRPVSTEEFIPHPRWPQYEYRIIIRPYYGASLNKISVELREKDKPDQIIELTTLKARRKLYVPDT
jgi:prepilin-type N-terminal cleavage/methylation domain-containing protein